MTFSKSLKQYPTAWNSRHWPLCVLLALTLTVGAGTVEAAYNVTDSMRWDRQWTSGSIGLGKDDVVEALCKACPLELGIEQVLPKDFPLLVHKDVDQKIKVNYTAGKPWGALLQEIAAGNDLKIEIFRHGQRVIVSNAPKKQGGLFVVGVQNNVAGAHSTKTWELIPPDTLKTSLERWAESVGWKIIYDLDNDIHVDVYASFQGDLIEAVRGVLEAYKSTGILNRVGMNFSRQNQVIRISLTGSGANE